MTPMAGNVLPKVSAKFVPVYNGKVQTHCGVISPLTKEFIGTGVEASLHSSLPVEIEGKVTKGLMNPWRVSDWRPVFGILRESSTWPLVTLPSISTGREEWREASTPVPMNSLVNGEMTPQWVWTFPL